MIIACPECDTRFVVPSTVFMKGGRKVRCASCKHSWFQEEPEHRSEAVSNAVEKMRKAEKKAAKKKSDEGGVAEKIKGDFKHGYVSILLGFAVVIAGYFIYQMLNPKLIVGQGLAFDKMVVTREGATLTVTGEIVNAMDADRGVPPIYVMQILADDVHGDSLIFKADKDILHSGEVIPLMIVMHDVGDEVKNLTVSFNAETGLNAQPHEGQPISEHHEEDVHHEENTHAAPQAHH